MRTLNRKTILFLLGSLISLKILAAPTSPNDDALYVAGAIAQHIYSSVPKPYI